MNWWQLFTTSALTSILTIISAWLLRPYLESYLRKKGENRAVIEDLDKINRTLEEIKRDFVERNAYLTEKGKAAATKEDVEEINRKIEGVRVEYTKTIELMKWQLSKKAALHRLQIEKEFEVFSKIWDAAIDLKFATQELRPIVEHINPDESYQERWNKKYKHFGDQFNQFFTVMEKQRPFYPNEIYTKLIQLLETARAEKIDCEITLNEMTGRISLEGYKNAQENIGKLLKTLDHVCDVMRSRLRDENTEVELALPE